MIRLTLICDDCNVDVMAEAFNLDDLDLDVVPEDWVETPGGKIYCAGCKMKHGAELAEVGTNVEIDTSGEIEKRVGVVVVGEGGEAGQADTQSLAREPETKAQSESAAVAGADSHS